VLPAKLPSYTVAQLERLAESLLRDSFGDHMAVPVDVEFLLESRDDVDFDFWPGLSANHQTVGAVFFDLDQQRFLVVIDEALADDEPRRNFYRMTVAEELGHVVLHGDIIRRLESIDDFRLLHRHGQWEEIERNAKRFAAAVLMPGSVLVQESNKVYGELVKHAGFGNVEVIQKYLRNQLAKRFEVSPQSMGYRLNEWPMKINAKVEAAMAAQLDYL